MSHFTEYVALASMLSGMALTIIGALVNAKIIKGKNLQKLVALLEAGHDLTTALSRTTLTQDDVLKSNAKVTEKVSQQIQDGIKP